MSVCVQQEMRVDQGVSTLCLWRLNKNKKRTNRFSLCCQIFNSFLTFLASFPLQQHIWVSLQPLPAGGVGIGGHRGAGLSSEDRVIAGPSHQPRLDGVHTTDGSAGDLHQSFSD